MKTGLTFDQFEAQVKNNAAHREDVLTQMNNCTVATDRTGHSTFTINGIGDYDTNDVFTRDLFGALKFPRSYAADLSKWHPSLLDANFNVLLKADSSHRLIRSYDAAYTGERAMARTVLSPSYLPLNDDEMVKALRPILDTKGIEVQSAEISPTRTWLKITTPKLKGEVSVSGVVQAGVSISNNEIGRGRIVVTQFLYRLVCTNGMVRGTSGDAEIHRLHRSSALPNFGLTCKKVEAKTADRHAAKNAIWNAVSESVGRVMQGATFQDLLASLQAANQVELIAKADTVELFERLGKQYGLTEQEQNTALANFETDAEKSVWGIANAITKLGNTTESYERASLLERIGGQIIQLPERDWKRLAQLNQWKRGVLCYQHAPTVLAELLKGHNYENLQNHAGD